MVDPAKKARYAEELEYCPSEVNFQVNLEHMHEVLDIDKNKN